jgi:DNA invertase Pin-like site-specific DNA recombinase
MNATKTGTLRAAIYCRVSQDNAGGASVAEQTAESLEVCEENGWTVTEVYDDNDIRASRFTSRQRPDWLRLIDALHADKLDMLVLWESSRGTRNPEVWFSSPPAATATSSSTSSPISAPTTPP